MKILIVGKNNIMKWPQSTYSALRSIQPFTQLFLYNKKTFYYLWLHLFSKQKRLQCLAKKLKKKICQYQPDAIVFVGAFLIPKDFFYILKNFPNIKKAAWCGDKFKGDVKPLANCLDILFLTDCGFEENAKDFSCKRAYLPLCANPLFSYTQKKSIPPFFTGALNPTRLTYLAKIKTKCLLYLKGKKNDALNHHEVHYHTISHKKMLNLMSKSICPINIGLSTNNVTGLNFRVFEAAANGGLIMVNKECKDIEKCYTVGTEALVYNSPDDLDNLVKQITQNPEKYENIAKAGYDKTLSFHTYKKRMEQMIKQIEELS